MQMLPYRRWAAFLTLAFGFIVLALTSSSSVLRADEFNAGQKAEIENVVKSYLLQNPEVLRDALVELEKRQKVDEARKQGEVVDDKAAELFSGTNSAVLGNANGKVTLVEFFDYNCVYCKRTLDDVGKLMKNEPELRLILKDFPVLGPGSVEAAKIATAARNQFQGDVFWQFHSKLLTAHGPIGKAQALAVAKDLGADMDRLTKDSEAADVKSAIERTMDVADSLSLTGTPSFVVGKSVVVGAIGYDQLKDRIDNMLKCGKALCS